MCSKLLKIGNKRHKLLTNLFWKKVIAGVAQDFIDRPPSLNLFKNGLIDDYIFE